tara:strand:+ start:205 stop:411 length:207 start_codon:yes stop_codon:yes gene_type:complete
MSKTGNWVLELEEEFYDKCADTILDCEHIEEFRKRMTQYHDLIKHFSDDDIDEIVDSTWNDYWEENRP